MVNSKAEPDSYRRTDGLCEKRSCRTAHAALNRRAKPDTARGLEDPRA